MRKIIQLIVIIFVFSSCTSDEIQVTNTYNITYFGNGNTDGSVPEDNNDYEVNDLVIVAANYGDLRRNGDSFSGWNTMIDGSGEGYLEEENMNIDNSNIELYAQWSDDIVYHELTSENQLIITGLPEIGLNDWYFATVDFLNGKLLLNQEMDLTNFQFHYKSGGDNYGFLRISQNFFFSTAVKVVTSGTAVIKIIESENIIGQDLFESLSVAEISGNFVNWSSNENVFIPMYLTIEGSTHFGFLKVSFNDIEGILTIHSIAYNRVANESIVTY